MPSIIKEAIIKEAIVKEAIIKEAIIKEAIVKEAIVIWIIYTGTTYLKFYTIPKSGSVEVSTINLS